jgi:ribosomal protein S24E
MGTIDIEFKKYEENPEMNRKEIEFVLSFGGSIPSRKEILDEISTCYGAEPGRVFLEKLRPVRKQMKANGRARIYTDAASLKKFEAGRK